MTHSYCINKNCDDRQNSSNAQYCQSCGTALLINNRYRLIQTLRELDYEYNAEIFIALDYQDKSVNKTEEGEYKQKILKVLTKKNPYFIELFQQEQTLLMQFQHPGIPRGEDAFEVFVPKSNSNLRCLVMEKIEGVDLEKWIQLNPPVSGQLNESTAVNWLQQITEILNYIHKQGFFHRDIKPSNIMMRGSGQLVLIDFGTARYVTQTVVNGDPVTVIQSFGYTAPEQLKGRAVPESDFYALGRTFVHLLTGKHPDTISPPGAWRQQTQPFISEPLKDLIAQLMEEDPSLRTQSLQKRLNLLQQTIIKPTPAAIVTSKKGRHLPVTNSRFLSKKKLLFGGIVFSSLLGLFVIVQMILPILFPPAAEICDTKTDDLLSCGEQVFLAKDALGAESAPPKTKEEGAKAIQEKRYPDAERLFQEAWEESQKIKKPDPETLIYLNNVKIARRTPNESVYTLAIAAPLSTPDGNPDTGLDLLRAVAMAQNKVVESGLNVRIIVANDKNDVETAKSVAEDLVQRQELLGVIGHYASETTLASLPIYEKHNLVLVSGTSTSTRLTRKNYPNFFRTVSTTRDAAEELVRFLQRKGQKKAATLYDVAPGREFSHDIRDQFNKSVKNSGAKIVKEFDLSTQTFSPSFIFEQVQTAGVTALALFPSGNTDPNSFENMQELVQFNRGRFWIVGGNPLYSRKLLRTLETMAQAGPFPLERLVVVVDWHPLEFQDSDFVKETKMLWKGDVGWRNATTYDAAQVLITGLEKLRKNFTPTRQNLLKIITNEGSIEGVTGPIQFDGGDRVRPNVYLLKVIRKCNGKEFDFAPLDYEHSCSPVSSNLELER
jgi:eukaryotic-like serine/threonine-protein kinase